MAKFKGGTTVTESLEVSGNIVDLSGDVGTSGQILTAVESGDNEVKITASDGSARIAFGSSVAVGNGKIVVGAYASGSVVGAVYVYDLDGTGEVKITASDGATNDSFGYDVAVGNNKVVVGAYSDDISSNADQGSVYVYNLDGTGETKITASDGAASDDFGYSVDIGNNKIVVGAYGDNSDTGAVYVYNLDGTGQTKITASDGSTQDAFGVSVAIGNNKIVVGVPDITTSTGAVYVYDLDGSNEVKITASDGATGDLFGYSVAIGNNKIVVGAYSDDNSNGTDAGAAYIYNLDGTGEVKITASDGATGDLFGNAVSVGDSKIIVGAVLDASNIGSAYVYDLDGSNEVKITASDGEIGSAAAGAPTGDYFGYDVAVGNSKIVVGAGFDDIGSNLDEGSAYVYDLAGTNWATISSNSSTGITNYIKCVCASATNLNTSGTASTLSWMNTTPSFSNGFSAPTATQITVPNNGLYLIGLNLDISQTNTGDNTRFNHGFEIEINGTAIGGAEVRHNYIRGASNNSNHFESSANAMKTLALSANDTISISQRRLAGDGVTTPQLTTNSSIFVVQIA